MARILMLTGKFPFPVDDGWKIRTSSLIRELSRSGHEIHLLSFANEPLQTSNDSQGGLARFVSVPRRKAYGVADLVRGLLGRTPFQVLHFRRADFQAAFEQMVHDQSYDVLLVEDIVMAQYALDSPIPVRILDMHNVESELLRRFAAGTSSALKAIYARSTAAKLARYERLAANRFDLTLTCSPDDRTRLEEIGVARPIRVIPNGVETTFYDAVADTQPEGDTIAFIGSMDYHANISGVSHFVRDIFPLILRDRPSTRLLIVGKNPPASITGLASGNIVVTGAVDDVRPYLARAAVMVVPLLVGGGTRLKILEAMAAGRPVVSTSLGAEGLAVGPEQIVVRDEPDAFATAVVALLADADARERMSRAAHEFVANTYDWSTIVAGLNEAITDLVAEATLK